MSTNIRNNTSPVENFLMSLDETYYRAEKDYLNPLGYESGIGTLTAICGRAPMALIQGAIGIIGFSAELFMGLATLGMQGDHFDSAKHCLNHIGQSGLNLGRAVLEVIPRVAQEICKPYDEAGESILPYRFELKATQVIVGRHSSSHPNRPFRS